MIESRFADLGGLHAVVTGASSGIGHAVSSELARAGADVVLHCRQSRDEAETLAAEIRSNGRKAEIAMADFSDANLLPGFVTAAWNCFGCVDIWVNCAGVDLLTGSEAELDYSQKLQKLLDVDVRSTILLGRLVGQKMNDVGQGVLLNILKRP